MGTEIGTLKIEDRRTAVRPVDPAWTSSAFVTGEIADAFRTFLPAGCGSPLDRLFLFLGWVWGEATLAEFRRGGRTLVPWERHLAIRLVVVRAMIRWLRDELIEAGCLPPGAARVHAEQLVCSDAVTRIIERHRAWASTRLPEIVREQDARIFSGKDPQRDALDCAIRLQHFFSEVVAMPQAAHVAEFRDHVRELAEHMGRSQRLEACARDYAQLLGDRDSGAGGQRVDAARSSVMTSILDNPTCEPLAHVEGDNVVLRQTDRLDRRKLREVDGLRRKARGEIASDFGERGATEGSAESAARGPSVPAVADDVATTAEHRELRAALDEFRAAIDRPAERAALEVLMQQGTREECAHRHGVQPHQVDYARSQIEPRLERLLRPHVSAVA